MARAHLFLAARRFHRVVIGLLQGFVGERGLGFLLQPESHQQLVAQEREPPLEVGIVAELLLLGGLRDHDDVGEIGDQMLALGFGRRRLHLGAHILLGEREVALLDVDAVDAGDDRVGAGRPASRTDEVSFEQPETAGRTSSSAAMAANAVERRRGAGRGGKSSEIMAWSWRKAAVGGAGQSRNEPRLAIA